jgi:hypothetical protein
LGAGGRAAVTAETPGSIPGDGRQLPRRVNFIDSIIEPIGYVKATARSFENPEGNKTDLQRRHVVWDTAGNRCYRALGLRPHKRRRENQQ